jgi:hypothetical protein
MSLTAHFACALSIWEINHLPNTLGLLRNFRLKTKAGVSRLPNHHAVMYRGVEVKLHASLISTVDGDKWSDVLSAKFVPWNIENFDSRFIFKKKLSHAAQGIHCPVKWVDFVLLLTDWFNFRHWNSHFPF